MQAVRKTQASDDDDDDGHNLDGKVADNRHALALTSVMGSVFGKGWIAVSRNALLRMVGE